MLFEGVGTLSWDNKDINDSGPFCKQWLRRAREAELK